MKVEQGDNVKTDSSELSSLVDGETLRALRVRTHLRAGIVATKPSSGVPSPIPPKPTPITPP
jgi:hypothetical protein